MLKKLLKYELSNIFKFLSIFYCLAIFFALLTRLFFNIENSLVMNVIGKICSGAAIAMMFNILINNLTRNWVRFRQNLYGDESYLTHTLPISKKTLYLSKILTSIITLLVSMLVIALTIFIAYYSKENIEILKSLLLPITNMYNSTIFKFIFAILLVFFLEIANLLQTGYTGIILGHKLNNNKIGFSVLFGFITYMVTQQFVLLVMIIIGLFNKDIMNLFITNEMINIDILKTVMYISIAVYSLTLLICYFINVNLFKKGVNVD